MRTFKEMTGLDPDDPEAVDAGLKHVAKLMRQLGRSLPENKRGEFYGALIGSMPETMTGEELTAFLVMVMTARFGKDKDDYRKCMMSTMQVLQKMDKLEAPLAIIGDGETIESSTQFIRKYVDEENQTRH